MPESKLLKRCFSFSAVWLAVFVFFTPVLEAAKTSASYQQIQKDLRAGRVCEAKYRWHDAIRNYQKVLDANPRNLQALSGMGNSFYHLKQYPTARGYYWTAMQSYPAVYYKLAYPLAKAYLREGNVKHATNIMKDLAEHEYYLATKLERHIEQGPNFIEGS